MSTCISSGTSTVALVGNVSFRQDKNHGLRRLFWVGACLYRMIYKLMHKLFSAKVMTFTSRRCPNGRLAPAVGFEPTVACAIT